MTTQLRKRGGAAASLSSPMKEHTTAADLFCGAGGLSIGLQAIGCRIVFAADSDPAAVQSYRSNFQHRVMPRCIIVELRLPV